MMFDEKIVSWMLRGPAELNDIYRYLEPSLLRKVLLKDYKAVADGINQYYLKHRVPPSIDVLKKLMDEDGEDFDVLDFISTDDCDDNEIGYYVDKIKNRFNKFIVKGLASKIEDDCNDVDDINNEISKVLSTTQRLYKSDAFSEGDFTDSTKNRLSSYKFIEENPEQVTGVLSGYRELDEYTWGIKNSEMMVIAGGSSSGKSLLMMNMAINAWLGNNDALEVVCEDNSGKNIIFFSLEMSKEQLEARMDANIANIRHKLLCRGQLIDEEKKRWLKSLSFQEKYNKNFYIIDMPRGSTVAEIQAKYESACGIFEPDAIYIDYLQLLSPSTNSMSDWESVGKVSEELHEFCRKYNKPVITAAQRKARQKQKGSKSFKDFIDLEDIGRSKMIGDNANIVLLIEHRDEENLREDMPIHIVKNRDGAKGKIVLKKEFSHSRVVNLPDGWAQDFGEENEL